MKFGAEGIRIQCVGPARRRRDGPPRVVPRGPRAAAHAARRHRLRPGRGQDDLRRDRREVLDLQGRGRATRSCSKGTLADRRRRTRRRGRPMLQPKKVKYRKMQKGRMRGKAQRGSTVAFGDFGLQALEPGTLTARQIEAARIAMTRHVKRGGKIWIRDLPGQADHEEARRDPHGQGQGQSRGVGGRREAAAGSSTRWKACRARWRARRCAWRRTSCRCRRASWRARSA